MKIVNDESKLESLFLTAKTEAKNFLVMMSFTLKNIFKTQDTLKAGDVCKNRTVQLGERLFSAKKTSKLRRNT